MLKFVKIVTYYAPIAFFAIFADLVASYGPQITEAYGRALLLYYPLCAVYIFTAFPLFAWFGGGKGAVKVMFQHIVKPAVVSLGTCSSVATIPTNMEEAEATGISKERIRHGASPWRDDAHGRLVFLVRAENRVCTRRVRAGYGH